MNEDQVSRAAGHALEGVEKTFAQERPAPAPSAVLRQATAQPAPIPRAVPRQAQETTKLTPVEHMEQSLEHLNQAMQLLRLLGERLTGTSSLSEPIDPTSTPSGVFNQLHWMANRVDKLADEIQDEVARIRDWV